ncbi:hypothetical protein M408DRAFT_171810 [Serendipita vermifera MAFF 305830]|uniref:Uncharacterized protein n=1 Tax=Serendipita vermifera MAFF 305830 TaxID=933852 RepID=A0A0C2XDV3_SERVB|nr:hypothetical protein M408DRAFT_171810 [Serendipita vermifera MAFF 305830]
MGGAEPIIPTGPYKSEGLQQRHDGPITFLQSRFDRMWIAEHDLATPTDIQLPVESCLEVTYWYFIAYSARIRRKLSPLQGLLGLRRSTVIDHLYCNCDDTRYY